MTMFWMGDLCAFEGLTFVELKVESGDHSDTLFIRT